MKRIVCCFFFLFVTCQAFSQVKTLLLNQLDQITSDSSKAASYAVYGKLTGDSVYTFKKFDLDNNLLTSGSFKDDSLHIPHGKFVYYEWIIPPNSGVDPGFAPDGMERFVSLTGSYLDGTLNGRWISFYPGGSVKQVATYVRGILHGGFQYYDLSGKVMISGLYIAGKKSGTWLMRGGKQEDEYVNGQLVSSLSGKKLRAKQAAGKN